MLWADGALAEQPLILGLSLGQLVTTGLLGAILAGMFTLVQTVMTKKLRTPADRIAAEAAANDLILKLLDRANGEIKRYEELIAKLSSDANAFHSAKELADTMLENLDRVTKERDRLSVAINYLRDKAKRTGHLTYAEIVVWARNALDPSVDLGVFDVGFGEDGSTPPPNPNGNFRAQE